MVGPAFAASLMAAAATLMPFPAGAYDQIPSVLSDSDILYSDFPIVTQFSAEFLRNAIAIGCLCASIPMLNYFKEINETGAQEMAENY